MAVKIKDKKKVSASEGSRCNEDLTEKIQKKAYDLFKKRGYTHGNDWSDWFEAESMVRSKKN